MFFFGDVRTAKRTDDDAHEKQRIQYNQMTNTAEAAPARVQLRKMGWPLPYFQYPELVVYFRSCHDALMLKTTYSKQYTA